jgi:hypothetical protein
MAGLKAFWKVVVTFAVLGLFILIIAVSMAAILKGFKIPLIGAGDVAVVPVYGTPLQNGHNYTVMVGTEVKDLAGNGLVTPYSWSFSVAGVGEDSGPVVYGGMDPDHYVGRRWSDGSTGLELELEAADDYTSPLTVTATHESYSWNLAFDGNRYSYQSAGDEGLSSGAHTLSFAIKDGILNEVSFERDIFIFGAA